AGRRRTAPARLAPASNSAAAMSTNTTTSGPVLGSVPLSVGRGGLVLVVVLALGCPDGAPCGAGDGAPARRAAACAEGAPRGAGDGDSASSVAVGSASKNSNMDPPMLTVAPGGACAARLAAVLAGRAFLADESHLDHSTIDEPDPHVGMDSGDQRDQRIERIRTSLHFVHEPDPVRGRRGGPVRAGHASGAGAAPPPARPPPPRPSSALQPPALRST